MSKALLIIDVQNDFTEGGALAVTGGNTVAEGITAYLAQHAETYDFIIASRDWHDADNDNGGHFAAPGAGPDFITTWPVHCVAGTPGADYDPGLDRNVIDIHVRKGQGRPAYSLFEGSIADGREFLEVAEDLGIYDVDVVGLATDYCVLQSATDALNQGWQVRVFSDLVAGVAPETSATALAGLATAGAMITTTNEAK